MADRDIAPPSEARFEGRFSGVTGSLRRHAARGSIVNAGFRTSLAGLALIQRIVVAALLTPAELGVWGVVLITLLTLLFFKSVGISDKFVQQSEDDQEVAFQKAFTFELAVTTGFVVLSVAALPGIALLYGKSEILFPALVLSLVGFGNSLQAPAWIFYRQMDYVRQRALEAVDPVLTFVITIGLAVAGLGYWSLVVGAVAGSWIGGLVAIRACPYPIRLVLDRVTARAYLDFSWPLAVARLGGLVVAQGSVLVGTHAVGLEGVGVMVLALSVIGFADGVDAVVTQTIYPAICAVRNDSALFLETFVKSNRMALMWGMPFGLGVALFAEDLVHFVVGDRYRAAVLLLQVFGVMTAVDQIGFNWTAFLRARDETRPLAIIGALMALTFCAITAPLLVIYGLHGYAIGMAVSTAITLVARTYYLARMLDGFRMLGHAARAVAPSVPAAAAVLIVRMAAPSPRALATAILEVVVYVVVTVGATLVFERRLLRETVGYFRRLPTVSSGSPQAG